MKRLLAMVLAVLLALMCCACGVSIRYPDLQPSGKDENGNWIFDKEVLIGRVAPLTGSLASFGDGTPQVEQQAIDAVNRSGGIVLDGQRCKLVLLTENSGSSTKEAQAAAERLIQKGVSIILVAHVADTVSPVSSVCEREGIPCISVDAPTDAWVTNGPYENSWHTHFNTESEILCFFDAWEKTGTNRRIGLVTANDIEGIEMTSFIEDFAQTKNYTVVDPGRCTPGNSDFGSLVATLKKNNCEIVLGVMEQPDFIAFWQECRRQDYNPEVCTIAKACIFESSIQILGDAADGLISEVWWSDEFPFESSITGQSCKEFANTYRRSAGLTLEDGIAPTIAHKHANVEIACDILRRAGSLDLEAIKAAAAETDLDTIVGHVAFNGDKVSLMNCVTGQWQKNGDGKIELEIVINTQLPEVETTSEIYQLPKWEEKE